MNFFIEHIGLAASNSIELKNWYERAFGARVKWQSDQNPPSYLLTLASGAMLEIYPANSSDPSRTGDNKLAGFRHLAWRVDSLAKAKTELEARGVTFTEEIRPAGGGGQVLFFADAEGNLHHLVERPV